MGYADEELDRLGRPRRDVLRRGARGRCATGAELVTVVSGEGAPLERPAVGRSCRTASSSTTTRAASRPGGGSCRRVGPVSQLADLALHTGSHEARSHRPSSSAAEPRAHAARARRGSTRAARGEAGPRGEGGRGARPARRSATSLEHFPFRHEDRREARPIASLGPGEDVTVVGEVRSDLEAPRPGPALTVAGHRGRRDRAARRRSGSTSRGSPTASRRHAGRAPRALPGHEQRPQRVRVRGRRGRRRRTRPGVVPVYPATEHLKSTQKIRELVWNARAARSATSSSRCRPGCGWPSGCPTPGRGVDAVHFPDDEADGARGAPAARVRGAVPARAVAGGAQAGARIASCGRPPLEGSGELVGPVGARRCRSR